MCSKEGPDPVYIRRAGPGHWMSVGIARFDQRLVEWVADTLMQFCRSLMQPGVTRASGSCQQTRGHVEELAVPTGGQLGGGVHGDTLALSLACTGVLHAFHGAREETWVFHGF